MRGGSGAHISALALALPVALILDALCVRLMAAHVSRALGIVCSALFAFAIWLLLANGLALLLRRPDQGHSDT